MEPNEVFVLWCTEPEYLQVYHLTDLSDEELAKVEVCHGHRINACDEPEEAEDAMNWLSEILGRRQKCLIYDSRTGPPDAEASPPCIHGPLIVTGFIL